MRGGRADLGYEDTATADTDTATANDATSDTDTATADTNTATANTATHLTQLHRTQVAHRGAPWMLPEQQRRHDQGRDSHVASAPTANTQGRTQEG